MKLQHSMVWYPVLTVSMFSIPESIGEYMSQFFLIMVFGKSVLSILTVKRTRKCNGIPFRALYKSHKFKLHFMADILTQLVG